MDRTAKIYGTRTETFLRNAKRIHMPWGVDPMDWQRPDLRKKRSIDVNMICMIHGTYPQHENRRRVKDLISQMPITKRFGNVYGRMYRDLLLDSKIFIVLTGNHFLTQKYLEGAMSGCLLIGDIPTEPTKTFVHGETMIGVKDYEQIPGIIEKYLKHPEERNKMVRECYTRVKKNYNIEKTTKVLTEALF